MNLTLTRVELILIGFAASFAAKLADTFGSEIGKIYGRNTFLISSLRRVPPGTEGAISPAGTLATILGSLLMTISMTSLSIIPATPNVFLVVLFSGFIATLCESVIGAVIQHRFDWLTNELVNSLQTSISALIAICLSIIIV